MLRTFAVLLCLAAAACGSNTAPTTVNADMTGTWSGPIAGNTVGTMRLTLSQNSTTISGTWVITVDGVTSGGPMGGTVSGHALSASLRSGITSDQCRLDMTANVTSTKMVGTYALFGCDSTAGGSLDLAKQ